METSPPTKRHLEQKKPHKLVAGTGTNTDEDEEEPGEIIAKRSRHPRQATATGPKFWPMQILGPHPNGKKAVWYLVALEMPSENLSGLNSLASFPQMVGSW